MAGVEPKASPQYTGRCGTSRGLTALDSSHPQRWVRRLEQPALRRWLQWIGVEAQIAKMISKLGRAMGTENLARLNEPHGFDELIKIGVVGEWQRMVYTQAKLRARVRRPACDGD